MTPLIERHLTWLRASGAAAYTIDRRRRLLRHLDAALPDGIEYACEEELAEYFAAWTGWTLYTYDGHARSFYRWCAQRGAIALNPMAWIPKPGPGPRLPHPCTDAELAIALGAPAPYGRAMLLAARAGLRCGEIARARRRHIADGRLRVFGKGGKIRTVPLDEVLVDELASESDWLLGREITPESLTDHQRPTWQALGLGPEFRLHSGRHWFATRLLETGALITEVQQLLGHSSLATTQIYLQVVDARTAAAVARLPRVRQPEPAPTRLGPSRAA
ncbi:MAG TPA: tyrosine-type recombinase/integrase [Micromonosporaceae bacterium]|jgi:integrase/recombinase XerC